MAATNGGGIAGGFSDPVFDAQAVFAATMRAYIDREIAQCREIEPEAHRRDRTILNRLRWAFGYFVMVTADYNLARRLNLGSRRGKY